MAEEKRSSFLKPTVDSAFHIDFEWWKSKEENWKSILSGYCCEKHKDFFVNTPEDELIDFVDAQTGEVTRKDMFIDIVMSHCAQEDGFLFENGAVMDTIFRMFLRNGNKPMTIREIAEELNRPGETILRILTARTYRGIRPL